MLWEFCIAVIRKSPTRWWFYFWLATLPLILTLIFIQPLVIDPMFHKFEPLQAKDPGLTAELEKMVQHAGETIPPERMFWMGAEEEDDGVECVCDGIWRVEDGLWCGTRRSRR